MPNLDLQFVQVNTDCLLNHGASKNCLQIPIRLPAVFCMCHLKHWRTQKLTRWLVIFKQKVNQTSRFLDYRLFQIFNTICSESSSRYSLLNRFDNITPFSIVSEHFQDQCFEDR
jgi:hypothetical protein